MANLNTEHRTGRSHKRHRGISGLWMVTSMTGLCMIASLAVDYARVQVAKTELRRAVDSAARSAAVDIASGLATVRATATNYAKSNKCDGRDLDLQPGDITVGIWNSAARSFTPVGNGNYDQGNSVRVATGLTNARGSAIRMSFASVLGFKTCDISTEAVALYVPPINVNQSVAATANPYLAGMPKDTKASLNNPHSSPDTAGDSSNWKQSPLVVNMPLIAGQSLTFDSIDGTARHDPGLGMFSPDGELADIGGNLGGAEHGKSDLVAPINALVAVFLDDSNPTSSATPATLDFSTQAARDFTSLQPKLKQTFFIGDGRNTDGAIQQFVVPQGATRLYLATWDFWEWNNNGGQRTVTISRPGKTVLVR